MNRKLLIPFGVFVVVFGFLLVGLTLNPREVPSPLIGKPAPAFRLSVLHQPDQRLAPADLAGKVWLLNVWASWCTACRVEHPLLVEIARSKAVPLIGLDYKDKPEDALKFLAQQGNPYQLSALDLEGRVGIDYGVYGVPETFIIDKNGRIRHKHVGPITPESLQKEILPIIAELKKS